MPNADWTDLENDTLVAEYFAVFAENLRGQAPIKAERHRALATILPDRSVKSIEYKLQNVSGALQALGSIWLKGYAPATNFQMTLADAVVRWLDAHPQWLEGTREGSIEHFGEPADLFVGPPPTLANRPPPRDLDKMLRVARKFDVAGRDARNRALGRAGEKLVAERERATLIRQGRGDLAARIRWVSEEDGDGLGYDIASFDLSGQPRLIEVRRRTGGSERPSILREMSLRWRKSDGRSGACSDSTTFRRAPRLSNYGRRLKHMYRSRQ